MINVKLTVRLGIFYPAKKFWQDIEFNHMLDDAGLVVLKVRTFMHGETRLRTYTQRSPRTYTARCMSRSAKVNLQERNKPMAGPGSPPELSELEVYLNQLLTFCGGQLLQEENFRQSTHSMLYGENSSDWTTNADGRLAQIFASDEVSYFPEVPQARCAIQLVRRPRRSWTDWKDRLGDEVGRAHGVPMVFIVAAGGYEEDLKELRSMTSNGTFEEKPSEVHHRDLTFHIFVSKDLDPPAYYTKSVSEVQRIESGDPVKHMEQMKSKLDQMDDLPLCVSRVEKPELQDTLEKVRDEALSRALPLLRHTPAQRRFSKVCPRTSISARSDGTRPKPSASSAA